MRFPDFFNALDEREQDDFAGRAGTTANYIRTHLLAPLARRKTPRRELLEGLVDASAGAVTRRELLEHFYPPSAKDTTEREAAA